LGIGSGVGSAVGAGEGDGAGLGLTPGDGDGAGLGLTPGEGEGEGEGETVGAGEIVAAGLTALTHCRLADTMGRSASRTRTRARSDSGRLTTTRAAPSFNGSISPIFSSPMNTNRRVPSGKATDSTLISRLFEASL
jgi:hypothetical protein